MIRNKLFVISAVSDLALHVANHKLWLAVVEDQKGKVERWGGLILTGWSRYVYFALSTAFGVY